MLNIEAIKPRADGKYSPLLFKWLLSKRFKSARQVFQTGSSSDRTVYSDHWRPREIIIGTNYTDGFVGGRILGDVICGFRGVKSNSYAYSMHSGNLREITDEFWAEYERIGRCAWDHGHRIGMVGDSLRFTDVDDRRVCNWCSRQFESEIRRDVEVVTRTIWSEYRESVPAVVSYPCGSMGEAV